jgi:hypothetical protein
LEIHADSTIINGLHGCVKREEMVPQVLVLLKRISIYKEIHDAEFLEDIFKYLHKNLPEIKAQKNSKRKRSKNEATSETVNLEQNRFIMDALHLIANITPHVILTNFQLVLLYRIMRLYEHSDWNILVMAIMINAVQKQPNAFSGLKISSEKSLANTISDSDLSFVDYCVTKYQIDQDKNGRMVYAIFLAHVATRLKEAEINISCKESIIVQLRGYLDHLESLGQSDLIDELRRLLKNLENL